MSTASAPVRSQYHCALGYHHLVLPQMEVRWEMELMLPFYLKMALRLAP